MTHHLILLVSENGGSRFWTHEVWHPLKGYGYQFWSGIGSSILEFLVVSGAVLTAMWRTKRRFECHVESPENCHRWGHPVAGTGHRACRLHHPHAEEKGNITVEDIHRHHKESHE